MSNNYVSTVKPRTVAGEHPTITSALDAESSHDVRRLHTFYAVADAIATGELSHEDAIAQVKSGAERRELKASTCGVYLSQARGIRAMFDTMGDVESFADDECKGSRNLQRIYNAVKGPGKPKAKKALVDVVLAAIPNLSASDLDRVIRAATEQRDSLVVSSKAA